MPDALIEAVGLSKPYRVGSAVVPAVCDVSLHVGAGEHVAIVGRSGSGKSTLMALLGLLARPNAGRYLLRGCDVAGLSEDARARLRGREIGFVFQNASLLARATALENVSLPLAYVGVGRGERVRRARVALEAVGLGHRLEHWPQQLSGGEQQRVAIARALVNDPALILADEPTGALDSKTSGEILEIFANLNRDGRTVIVVTHDPAVASRASRRVVMDDGRIVRDDHLQTATKDETALDLPVRP